MPSESKGEQGGPCNWLWIKAKKSTCLIFLVKLGTGLKPHTLHQSKAVVGSRDLDEKTQQEIKALFNRTFCLPENIEQLRVELENFICENYEMC